MAGGEARLYYGDHPSAEGTREFAFRPISFHRTGLPCAGMLQLPWCLMAGARWPHGGHTPGMQQMSLVH